MMWYGQREGGQWGRIIDSQRALRFTAHKMEVSRTRCKSGQPISTIPFFARSTPRMRLSCTSQCNPSEHVPLSDNLNSLGRRHSPCYICMSAAAALFKICLVKGKKRIDKERDRTVEINEGLCHPEN